MKKLLYLSLLAISTIFLLGSCTSKDKEDVKYTVTFDSQGGTSVEALTVVEGSTISKPTDPTKEGSTFGGWYKEAAGTTAWQFSTDKVTSNITLYAKWITGEAYTVKFETYGGSPIPEPQVVEKGGKATRPTTDPTKDLHKFDDWYTSDKFSAKYDFNATVSADITIYAKWDPVNDRSELIASLKETIDQANALKEDDYESGWWNMTEKLEEAEEVYENIDEATDAEIFDAYMALKLAIENLTPKGDVDDTVARMRVSPDKIDGKVYVVTDREYNYFHFNVYFENADYDDLEIVAEFTYPGLEAWVTEGGQINVEDHGFHFSVGNVASGQNVNVTVKAKGTNFSETVTLETITYTEMVNKFKSLVDGLDPANIDYDDYEAIDKADDIYHRYLSGDNDLKDYYEKLDECWDAYWDLPTRVKYVMNGNKSRWVLVDEGDDYMDLVYESQGAFPLGAWMLETYAWQYHERYNAYVQYRYVFKSGGVFAGEYRTSYDKNGANPSAWMSGDDEKGTYTMEGNSSQGIFYITFEGNEETEEGGGSVEPDPGVDPGEEYRAKRSFARLRR